jgi:hypothetical protein
MKARNTLTIRQVRDGLRKAQLEAEEHYAEFKGSQRATETAGYWKGLALAYKLSAGDLDLLLGEDTREAGKFPFPAHGDCPCVNMTSEPPACFRCKYCGRTGK